MTHLQDMRYIWRESKERGRMKVTERERGLGCLGDWSRGTS